MACEGGGREGENELRWKGRKEGNSGMINEEEGEEEEIKGNMSRGMEGIKDAGELWEG